MLISLQSLSNRTFQDLMTDNRLHIIAFNIPFPANYGGVIDIYYKLKALREAGVMVTLHCFQYGRQTSKELEDLCFRVHYYPRNSDWRLLLRREPYIVATRNAKSMPEKLLKDPFPVLFEGLHTTSLLQACRAASKTTLVRMHNVEHEYYRLLSGSESGLRKRAYLTMEAIKLKRYERILQYADHILAISRPDSVYFGEKFGNTIFIPAFHRFERVMTQPGRGKYLLFHGNLGVPENSNMYLQLHRKVISGIPFPVVVAGKNPPGKLIRLIEGHSNIRLVADPTDDQMDALIRDAHVNLLFTGQATGIKLKLLHALFGGRHCVANSPMVHGSGLEPYCTVVDSLDQLPGILQTLMEKEIHAGSIQERKKALKEYSNRAGAEKILRVLN